MHTCSALSRHVEVPTRRALRVRGHRIRVTPPSQDAQHAAALAGTRTSNTTSGPAGARRGGAADAGLNRAKDLLHELALCDEAEEVHSRRCRRLRTDQGMDQARALSDAAVQRDYRRGSGRRASPQRAALGALSIAAWRHYALRTLCVDALARGGNCLLACAFWRLIPCTA